VQGGGARIFQEWRPWFVSETPNNGTLTGPKLLDTPRIRGRTRFSRKMKNVRAIAVSSVTMLV
jgi:hypothetical protein